MEKVRLYVNPWNPRTADTCKLQDLESSVAGQSCPAAARTAGDHGQWGTAGHGASRREEKGLWEVGSAHCDRPSWPGGAENCGWLQESALLTRCASYPGDVNSGDEQQPTQFINPETPGYVGFANLPNQVHRKSVKKGFEFTLMVVEKIERTVQIEASTVEIEERGVKLRLTVVDTPGYGDAINCRDCFKTIISYVDEQFERYLHDESGLNRRHIVDNRVHCCFYFISPFGHGLKPLDVAFMKAIHNKVNIVPVIAKADTLTLKERERLKKRILDEIEEHNIKIYHLPDAESDEDEDFKEQTRLLKASIPFSVVGSNQLIEAKGKKVRGRLYPWGVVEVENPEHNDFLKLRTMLITHMQDLQEVTQDLHYENFRSERLKRGGRKVENEDMNKDQILLEKEAELRRMQEMIARMQAQMQLQMQGGDGDGGVHGHHV
ncbi:Septin-2 [Pteropus alecto]|uniref:Septin-2 n=1 Tax=Pteropus alecto TaxID=9402 RepID=L5KTZ4_PTEAL|nr:Septin-2 [Pteropus alecto]